MTGMDKDDQKVLFVAVRGVMGELVSATVEQSFPVFTGICRDFSISGAKYGAPI